MTIVNLDEKTRTGLNELTEEEVRSGFAYNHEILWYGIDAVAHFHLMNEARNIPLGKLSMDDFIKKYSLTLRRQYDFSGEYIALPLSKIESDNIFIPRQAFGYRKRKQPRRIYLFNSDYASNRATSEHASQLASRKWQLSDLENLELIEQGVQFGNGMWEGCVWGFNQYKNGTPNLKIRPVPPKVTELAEELIAYYSSLILDKVIE